MNNSTSRGVAPHRAHQAQGRAASGVSGSGLGRGFAAALRGFGFGLALLSLGACSSIYRNHGYVPEDVLLEEVVVGVDTRDSVIGTLGNPSASGVLDQSGIYYVQSRFRHWAWRAPQVIDREIVAISFDDQGVVSNVERFGLEDGRVVVLSRRVTGGDLGATTLIDQLFSNFGVAAPGTGQPN